MRCRFRLHGSCHWEPGGDIGARQSARKADVRPPALRDKLVLDCERNVLRRTRIAEAVCGKRSQIHQSIKHECRGPKHCPGLRGDSILPAATRGCDTS